MSSTLSTASASPSRIRTARTAAAAVERARLALVPSRQVNAPRAPFAVLVLVVLAAGVVGLLMFNTHMQQSSFYATRLQQRADSLEARREALDLKLDQLRDPQHLAAAGHKLGMVVPANPAMVNLATGKILGLAVPATSADSMRINPDKAARPSLIDPKPLVHKVIATVPGTTPGTATATTTGTTTGTSTGKTTAKTGTAGKASAGKTAGNSGQTKVSHGTASTGAGTRADRKGAGTASQGASR
ncbi:MAG TPA: hypothetical protein VHZ06_02130 [Marmoricola sp.]|jgi:hypothetical protein|nr:hypothetical protein [Marmoricola sp.]